METKTARTAIIVTITAAILFLLFLGISHYYRRFTKQRFDGNFSDQCTDEQIKAAILSPKKHNDLVTLLKETHELMEAFKVQYWIISGTLLGAVRDGGVIPWDDDDDIGVLESEWKNVRGNDDFHAQLNARGLMLLSVTGAPEKLVFIRDWQDLSSTTVQITRVSLTTFMNRNAAFLDVFPYEIDPTDSQKLRMATLRDRLAFPGEYFYVENVFPRRKYAFQCSRSDAMLVFGPRNPFTYLTRNYGKNGRATWIDSAMVTSHSSLSSLLQPCRITITQVQQIKNGM